MCTHQVCAWLLHQRSANWTLKHANVTNRELDRLHLVSSLITRASTSTSTESTSSARRIGSRIRSTNVESYESSSELRAVLHLAVEGTEMARAHPERGINSCVEFDEPLAFDQHAFSICACGISLMLLLHSGASFIRLCQFWCILYSLMLILEHPLFAYANSGSFLIRLCLFALQIHFETCIIFLSTNILNF